MPQKVVAEFGAALAEPQIVEKPGDTPGLEGVVSYLVIGDWSGSAVDVVLSGIELVPPTETLPLGRTKLRELQAQGSGAGSPSGRGEGERSPQTPGDRCIPSGGRSGCAARCAVATDVLAVTLQAGRHVNNQLVPYVASPATNWWTRRKTTARHAVTNGRVVDYYVRALYRQVNGERTRVRSLSPDGQQVFIEGASTGQVLEETVVDLPAAYTVQSADDPVYAQPIAPAAVFRKGKPNGLSQPFPFLYTISLRLPSPLKDDATYTIRFVGVNTSSATVDYVHKPRTAWRCMRFRPATVRTIPSNAPTFRSGWAWIRTGTMAVARTE